MAGLGRKVFNSGDILLASEVQGFLQDQAVMVFDDDAARGSAIATPTEGMVTFRKDDNALEVFDGSVFAPIGSSPGLVHIKRESGSGVSGVNIDDCFSSAFSVYKITGIYSVSSAGGIQLNGRLRVGGANNVVAVHQSIQQNINTSGTVAFNNAANATSFNLQRCRDVQHRFEANVLTPFESVNTGIVLRGVGIDNGNSAAAMTTTACNHGSTTSFTGFAVFVASGTLTGDFDVWGYKG